MALSAIGVDCKEELALGSVLLLASKVWLMFCFSLVFLYKHHPPPTRIHDDVITARIMNATKKLVGWLSFSFSFLGSGSFETPFSGVELRGFRTSVLGVELTILDNVRSFGRRYELVVFEVGFVIGISSHTVFFVAVHSSLTRFPLPHLKHLLQISHTSPGMQ